MKCQSFTMAVAMVSLFLSSLAAAAQVNIVMMPVKLADAAALAMDPRLLDEALLTALADAGDFKVFGRSDMNAVIGYEAQKDLLGCNNDSCFAEIGAALGTERIVDTSLTKAKGAGPWNVTTKLINVRGKPEVLARLVQSIDGDANAVLAALPFVMRDLAAKAGLQVKAKSEIGFSPIRVTSAPIVDKSADSTAVAELGQINIEAENLLEAALNAEENPASQPEAKRRAWCALAEVTRNPYLARAKKACGEWTAYLTAARAANAQLATDYATVAQYLELKRKTDGQKLAVLDAFLRAYAGVDALEVRQVVSLRARLAAGEREKGGRCGSGVEGAVGCDPVILKDLGLLVETVDGKVQVVRCQRLAACNAAGLRDGDLLLDVDGYALQKSTEFGRTLALALSTGREVKVTGSRGSNAVVFRLVGERR